MSDLVEWKKSTAKYTGGMDAYMGRVRVGWAGWSATGSKIDVSKYAASVLLPGVKIEGKFMTEDEAKAKVEKVVAFWVNAASLSKSKPSQGDDPHTFREKVE
jgi:hypothetical protein